MISVLVLGGGVSGLATAYNIHEMAEEEKLKISLTILEKEKKTGGKVTTVREKGFLCEGGPSGFLDSRPETLDLCRRIGLKTLRSKEFSKKRYIYTGGRLRLVPDSPLSFLRSDILSLKGKMRVFLEPFTKRADVEDETVSDFASRHLGKEAEEKLIASMVAGIFAGDSKDLSVKSCFPVMIDLEKEGSGSLIRAMIRRMRAAKKGKKVRTSPGGSLTSFRDGMASLTTKTGEGLKGEIITDSTVLAVEKDSKAGYRILLEGRGTPLRADVLVLALPAYSASEILKKFDRKLSRALSKIPYVPASVVCLGYREIDLPRPLEGYGFLIPKTEGRKILGCRWDSSTFDYRAPGGHVLVEVIVGGAYSPDSAALGDNKLLGLVKEELKDILGIEEEPVYHRIFRWERAIPQYVVGHDKILEDIENRLKNYPGLFITGNAFRGIGINDCTKNAPMVAGKVIEYLKGLRA